MNGFTCDLYEGLFHAKLKMLSFTHIHFILNLYYFLLWNTKGDLRQNVLAFTKQ